MSRDEAFTVYGEALTTKPDSLRSLVGLGQLALETGRVERAAGLFRRAIAIGPEQSLAHRGLGEALKMLGDLPNGLLEDEWHHPPNGGAWRDFEQPLWTRASHEGQTVLMWAGGALGDTIQALRYLPLVKAHGGRLVVECPAPLVSLVGDMPDVDEVVTYGSLLPAFDVQERFTRLPLEFETTVNTIPNRVPYLVPHAAAVEKWRHRLRPNERLTVGLAWGGNTAHATGVSRFASLQNLASFGKVRNVRFVSLQLSPQASELLEPPPGLAIERVLDDACSVRDTAALMQHLDLVISVDTMIAHLAGGLAKPVWVALPHVTEWRWFNSGESTPWYPTMRLFRQEHEGDWDGVFGQIERALRDVAADGGVGFRAQARPR